MRRQNGRQFHWLMAAYSRAALGDGLMAGALPLLITAATTSPLVVSLLPAAVGAPWLLFGLAAGVLVDRADNRVLLRRAELVRVVSALAFATAALSGRAGIGLILGTAFVLSASTTVIRSAVPALVPQLVDRMALGVADGRLQTGALVTGSFAGPAAGGVLSAIGSWVPFAGQALSFATSYACLRRVRNDTDAAAPDRANSTSPRGRRSWTADLRQGLRFLYDNRVLRPLAMGTLGVTVAMGLVLGILVVHVVIVLHLPGPAYGLVLTAEAAGGLIGSTGVPAVIRRLRAKRSLVLAALLGTLSLAALYQATTLPTVVASMIILGAASMIWNVTAITTRQVHTPHHLLGRVSSSFNVLGIGAASGAAPLGGLIAATTNTNTAILAACVICAAATIYLAVVLPGTFDDEPQHP